MKSVSLIALGLLFLASTAYAGETNVSVTCTVNVVGSGNGASLDSGTIELKPENFYYGRLDLLVSPDSKREIAIHLTRNTATGKRKMIMAVPIGPLTLRVPGNEQSVSVGVDQVGSMTNVVCQVMPASDQQ